MKRYLMGVVLLVAVTAIHAGENKKDGNSVADNLKKDPRQLFLSMGELGFGYYLIANGQYIPDVIRLNKAANRIERLRTTINLTTAAHSLADLEQSASILMDVAHDLRKGGVESDELRQVILKRIDELRDQIDAKHLITTADRRVSSAIANANDIALAQADRDFRNALKALGSQARYRATNSISLDRMFRWGSTTLFRLGTATYIVIHGSKGLIDYWNTSATPTSSHSVSVPTIDEGSGATAVSERRHR